MTGFFDLDAYLARIGYSGPRVPTLDTLREIHARHPDAIPFENLNPLLGWPVALDVAALQDKLVAGRRGGWCFEQNGLFRHALEALGYHVTGLGARVLWNAPPGPIGPRSHMLLRVDIAGDSFVADVGFGGITLTAPLRLQPGVEQSTPHEPFRLRSEGPGLVMEARLPSGWRALYRFTLEEQMMADYEVGNWYLCHHPSSIFLTNVMAARATADRRVTLRNTTLSVHHRGGVTDERTLRTAGELRAALQHEFRLVLPDTPHLDEALARVCDRVEKPA